MAARKSRFVWLKEHKRLKKIPKWLYGAMLLVIIGVIPAIILLGHHHKATPTTENQDNNSDSSLAVNNSSSASTISITPQDTLAQWKSDPSYQKPLTNLSYSELFRNSDKYKGQFVHYTGEVIQVLGDPGDWNLRANITKEGTDPYAYWQDTVFIFSYSPDRVIENDIIDFTAQVNGVLTYKSTLGGDITIPSLTIYEQKVIGRTE